jgi:hypothetical protein
VIRKLPDGTGIAIILERKVMKILFSILVMMLIVSCAFSQVRYPNFQDTLVKIMNENKNVYLNQYTSYSLDSNEEYKLVKDGLVMQGGQVKLVRRGNLYPLLSPITLKNGSIVMPNGIIQMTNGNTPILKEEDFIDLDGNIKLLNPVFPRPEL